MLNSAWNEDTDKNMQDYIKKRTDKRMKEIKREVEEVKPVIFDKAYAN